MALEVKRMPFECEALQWNSSLTKKKGQQKCETGSVRHGCQQEGEKSKESIKDVNMLKVFSTHEWKYNYDAFWNYFRNSGREDEEES
jgi:hypothetical protein